MNLSNISVAIRVRPAPNQLSQISADSTIIISKTIQVIDKNSLIFDPSSTTRHHAQSHRKPKDQKLNFDMVLDEKSTQQYVFESTSKPLVDLVLDGYNATVFAYGATGCGTPDDPGIIYLTIKHLFERVAMTNDSTQTDISLSFLEVYNEKIKDLLDTSQISLDLREDDVKVSVAGLSTHKPTTINQVMHLLLLGNANRTQAFTESNATSSRSHAILQVNIKRRVKGVLVNACLSIIDLAGSERASQTKNVGERMVEGANINRSLLALGNCINALCEGRALHVPYRVVMIACVSASGFQYEETMNTLVYANRAKNIRNSLERNVEVLADSMTVKALQDENEDLKARLKIYEEMDVQNAFNESKNCVRDSRLYDGLIEQVHSLYTQLRSQESTKIELSTNISRTTQLIELYMYIHEKSDSTHFQIAEELDSLTSKKKSDTISMNQIIEDSTRMRGEIRALTREERFSCFTKVENENLNHEIGRMELLLSNVVAAKENSVKESVLKSIFEKFQKCVGDALNGLNSDVAVKIMMDVFNTRYRSDTKKVETCMPTKRVVRDDPFNTAVKNIKIDTKIRTTPLHNTPVAIKLKSLNESIGSVTPMKRSIISQSSTQRVGYGTPIKRARAMTPTLPNLMINNGEPIAYGTPQKIKKPSSALHLHSMNVNTSIDIGTPQKIHKPTASVANNSPFAFGKASKTKIDRNEIVRPMNLFQKAAKIQINTQTIDASITTLERSTNATSAYAIPSKHARSQLSAFAESQNLHSGPVRASPMKRLARNHARRSMIPVLASCLPKEKEVLLEIEDAVIHEFEDGALNVNLLQENVLIKSKKAILKTPVKQKVKLEDFSARRSSRLHK